MIKRCKLQTLLYNGLAAKVVSMSSAMQMISSFVYPFSCV